LEAAMSEERFGTHGTRRSPLAEVGFGAMRAALLFGSTAVALALVATPLLDRSTRSRDAVVSLTETLDPATTGSVRPAPLPAGGRYTLHRSVLQPSPGAVCIIRDDGSRVGSC
jgi:hypothetical protein